jgi:hypothetical protein
MVTAVVFDVGETLIDETRLWQQVAKDAGVPAFTLMATIGGLITRGEHHQRIWEVLEKTRFPATSRQRTSTPMHCLACGGWMKPGSSSEPSVIRQLRRRSCYSLIRRLSDLRRGGV